MKIESIKSNLFYLSQAAIDDFETFPWHRGRDKQIDTDKVQSSQAVMIDVFGLILQSPCKDEIINRSFGKNERNWKIIFEHTDKTLLDEPTPTQVDVLLESENEIIAVECKFTETDGGSCSQKNKISRGPNRGLVQCNGNYQHQENPVNRRLSKCSLIPKGVKYWEYIRKIYDIDISGDLVPCPFEGSHYQWMRNLCTAEALGARKNKASSFFICYYDSEKFSMKKKFDGGYLDRINITVRENRKVKLITYNEIVQTAIEIAGDAEKKNWQELAEWLVGKVTIIR